MAEAILASVQHKHAVCLRTAAIEDAIELGRLQQTP
jgi:hypothetical protein